MSTGAVKAGGDYQGLSGSLELNLDNFKKSESSKKWNKGKTTEYAVGTASQPEPIKLVLEEIDHTLNDEYWQGAKTSCSQADRQTRAKFLKKALEEYPEWLDVRPPESESLKIPLTWPKGTYALPQTDARCPRAKGFKWATGSRTQLSGSGFQTDPEKTIHFPRGSIEQVRVGLMKRYKVTQSFCLKSSTNSVSYQMEWPAGKYCIIKLGDCPTREFEKGSITWDDRSDKEQTLGSLPDGDFSTKGLTKIEYCCRDDGIASRPIFLPTDKSFYLLRFGGQCQKVTAMDVSDETILWDEPELISDTTSNGFHPDNTSKKNIELHFCYYSKTTMGNSRSGAFNRLFKMAKGIAF